MVEGVTNEAAEPIGATTRDFRPTRTEALAAIDAEIVRVAANDQRPGWTPWALAGSLAWILWVVAQEAEKTTTTWQEVGKAYIALFLVVEALPFGAGLEHAWPLSPGKFRRARQIMDALRAEMMFGLANLAVVAWLSYELLRPVRLLAFGIVALHCAGIALASLITALPFVQAQAVVPGSPATWVRRLLNGFGLAWLSYPAYCAVELAVAGSHPIAAARIAALAFASLVLVRALAASSEQSPMLAELRSIRYDLSFGRSEPLAALSRAEACISGSALGDILCDQIRRFHNASARQRSELLALQSEMTEARSALPGAESDWTEQHLAELSAAGSSFAKRLAAAEKLSTEANQLKRRVYAAAASAALISDSEGWGDLRKVIAGIEMERIATQVLSRATGEQVKTLRAQYSAGRSALRRPVVPRLEQALNTSERNAAGPSK